MPSFEKRFKIREPASILTTEKKRMIHQSALAVLERTGVRVHSAQARKELERSGALVDHRSMVVRFPEGVVESLLRTVPSRITLAGRTEEYDLPVDGTHHYYTCDGCGVLVWKHETKTRRNSVLADVTKSAILADWLPYLSIYEPMVVAHDVPAKMHVIAGMREAMKNTVKHIESESTTNPDEAKVQVRMASEVVGGIDELMERHYISAMVCTVSPLILDGAATDAGLVWAENHVPVHITAMGQMGMTGPATIAGNLVLCHAETLALACALQAHEPGAPVLYGSVLSSMEPRSGAVSFGSPETAVLAAATAEMARFMKWPGSCGGIGPGAPVPGMQAAIENAYISHFLGMVGSEIMNGIGLVDNSTVLSYEEMLIDNDIVGLTLASCRDVEVTPETLAVDLIEKVGIGGNFLAEMHTLKHVREFHTPLLWTKESYESWVKKGCKDLLDVAHEKATQILNEHKPEKLDPEISRRIDDIMKGVK
ncbi:MAG: trimethylamine methyltransferase family protein [Thermoplasmata archaeon]